MQPDTNRFPASPMPDLRSGWHADRLQARSRPFRQRHARAHGPPAARRTRRSTAMWATARRCWFGGRWARRHRRGGREGLAYFLSYYREHMLDNTVTYPGVREGLKLLDDRPMAVLTNKPVRFSNGYWRGWAVALFPVCVRRQQFREEEARPDRRRSTSARFEVAPPEAMMVGDSDVDVRTARNSGIWACGVSYGWASKACAPLRRT